MIVKIWAQGSKSKSLCITFPKKFCEKLGLEKGSYVMVILEDDKMILKPLKINDQ
ncbi:MAG TPA: AbrB/MazE/SpoVT family DNA-binding domain-containing protein [Methanothermococcus okinawensis]|uniref:AbrB/MazE/SpoVT family DNA-binding domain-containing protein n=1 Tax=Methanothermococcus okinawensis TaxID=155863 RepID=A0A832ZAN8_9EURY|nr:AbrB/MazE/SpoVT family DNA-binding domain-containing protein [Methanococcaceae archaeon]HIP84265.1 AbrB/MazE/SpoVT family DNA-binding domain-containing protein [Methanothermococcus okinawensis]HIP91430.1 AbrB/MazE/SpoVT family DNA-binding domain-containing protein [Methanothermococcus okinawensis]